MNLTYTRPGELRKPDVKVLPDGRIRVTRYIAAGHGDRDLSEVTESFGNTDGGLNTALLVEKGMARIEGKDAIVKTWEVRNLTGETPVGNEDVQWGENGLKTVIADFVQMSTQPYTPQTVGTTTSTYDATCILRNEVMDDDGSTRQIRRFYINKGLLKQVDETRNNGALLIRTLVYLNDTPSGAIITGYTLISQNRDNPSGLPTTTYTYAKGTGQVAQDDETKNNGALLLRTIRYLSIPTVTTNPITTPIGYTKVSESVTDQDGHRVWAATYAKGSGQISQDDEIKNNNALLIRTIRYLSDPAVTTNPISTPAGYTKISESVADQEGHRVWSAVYAKGTGQISQDDQTKNNGALLISTIRYLSTPSVTVNPITTPTGYTKISESVSDQDGHRVWISTYAKGTGQISQDDETKNNGALIVRTIRYIATPLSADPIATPSGYTKISETYADQDGHRIWTTTFAKGLGQIDNNYETRLSGMLIRVTITYLTDPSVTVNPTSNPLGDGASIVSTDVRDSDGHRVWTVVYVLGVNTSNVIESIEYRNKNEAGSARLVIYRRQRLGLAPTAPTATIGGVVVLVSSSTQLEDGYTLYNYTWAEGYGTISSSTETHNQGRLKIYEIVSAGYAPTTPSATIGGVVVLIQDSSRIQDGVTIYSRRWAEGTGVIEKRTQPRDGGLRIETWVSIGQEAYDASFMQPAGVLAAKDSDNVDGITRWTVTCYQKKNGDPIVDGAVALSYITKRPFTYPGRAKAYSASNFLLGANKVNYDVYKLPPVTALIDATVDITYQTSNFYSLLWPLWNPTSWATIKAWYLGWQGYPISVVEPLPNYRAEDTYNNVTFNGGATGYDQAAFGTRVYGIGTGSPYYIEVANGPVKPDGNTYTIETPMLEPAFIAYDGTQYYRKVIVSATIPIQNPTTIP